jgi:hypothetical protein
LREAQGLFLSVAGCLDGLMAPAYSLWRRLTRTATYKRANGIDNGAGEPVWDLAGTLEAMLRDDFENIREYLRRDARRAGAAAARRERRADQ